MLPERALQESPTRGLLRRSVPVTVTRVAYTSMRLIGAAHTGRNDMLADPRLEWWTLAHRLRFVVPWLALAGCDARVAGPTPSVTSVDPPIACQAQITTLVTVHGTGFSPLPTDGLQGRIAA